jgi:hypothetical protein
MRSFYRLVSFCGYHRARRSVRYYRDLLLVCPGRTVCGSVQVVSHFERSSKLIWSRLLSRWGLCYTVATWRRLLLTTSV